MTEKDLKARAEQLVDPEREWDDAKTFAHHYLQELHKRDTPRDPPGPFPLPLNAAQELAAKTWAADDRLWTTQETVEFNLRIFARVILASVLMSGGEAGERREQRQPEGPSVDDPRRFRPLL